MGRTIGIIQITGMLSVIWNTCEHFQFLFFILYLYVRKSGDASGDQSGTDTRDVQIKNTSARGDTRPEEIKCSELARKRERERAGERVWGEYTIARSAMSQKLSKVFDASQEEKGELYYIEPYCHPFIVRCVRYYFYFKNIRGYVTFFSKIFIFFILVQN